MIIWLWHVLAALVAAFVVLSLVRPLSWLAHHYGWVYTHPPTARDVIVADVPFTGGLIALVGMFAANLVSPWPVTAWGITLAMFMVIAFGLMADLAVLPRWHRMAVLAGASFATVIGSQALIASTGPLLGPVELSMRWIALPLSAGFVWFVAVAFRRVDRADGLCDGLALVAALGVLAVCVLMGGYSDLLEPVSNLTAVALAVTGTLTALAFFTWRHKLRRVAAIYLSNAGSSIMGLITAWLLLQAQGSFGPSSIGIGALLWMVSIPVADLLFFALRVVFTGSPEQVQDRSRLQHLLQSRSFAMGQAVMIQLGIAVALTAIAVGSWQLGVPDAVMFYGWLVGFAVYAWVAMMHWEGRQEALSVNWRAIFKLDRRNPVSAWSKALRRTATAVTADTRNREDAFAGGLATVAEGSFHASAALEDRAQARTADAADSDVVFDSAHASEAAPAAPRVSWSSGAPAAAMAPPRHFDTFVAERNDPLQRPPAPLPAIRPTWRTVAEIEAAGQREHDKAGYTQGREPQTTG